MNGIESVIQNAETWGSAGVGAGVGFFFVRWLAVFFAGRWDKKEEQIDAATRQIIETLRIENTRLSEAEKQTRAEMSVMREEFTQRFNSFEEALRQCERRHAEGEAEIMRLKAVIQGAGDARQHASLIVAAEKKDAKE